MCEYVNVRVRVRVKVCVYVCVFVRVKKTLQFYFQYRYNGFRWCSIKIRRRLWALPVSSYHLAQYNHCIPLIGYNGVSLHPSYTVVLAKRWLRHQIDWIVLTTGVLLSWRHKKNIFRFTVPLCGEFTAHRWIPFTKATEACVFFDLRLVNRWVNNREAGALIRRRIHYDVIVMVCYHSCNNPVA